MERFRRITQSQLEEAIERHSLWLQGNIRGSRAVFTRCDLSGLSLRQVGSRQINLTGADFSEADLSGIVGDDVNFHLAALLNTRLSWSILNAPVFSGAALRGARCDHVIWGWGHASDGSSQLGLKYPDLIAVFINTYLAYGTFDHSRIRGYFSGTTLHDSSMSLADFSYSDFAGVRAICETSFAGASHSPGPA